MGKIISFVNSKGGSCKSTSVINFASELKQKGYKVLIIDADPQSTITKFFYIDTRDRLTMLDVFFSDEEMEAKDLIVHTDRGDIVPSDPDLVHKINSATTIKQYKSPKKILRTYCKAHYDFILVDTQGAHGTSITSSLIMSDYVIVPTVPTKSNIIEIADTLKDIREVRDMDNDDLKILGILICNGKKIGTVTKLSKVFLESKSSEAETFIYQTLIRQSADIPSSELTDADVNTYLGNNELNSKACCFKKLSGKEKRLFSESSEQNKIQFLLDRIKMPKQISCNIKLLDGAEGYTFKWFVESGNATIDSNVLNIKNVLNGTKENIQVKCFIDVNGGIGGKAFDNEKTFDIKISKDNVGFDYKAAVEEMLEKIKQL